jgi:hypothetical protein
VRSGRDERDFEFARKHGLASVIVVQPDVEPLTADRWKRRR